jgi:hypothetical protein
MMQADLWERRGRHPSTHLDATYTYSVNGRRYVSHQLSVWSHDLSRAGKAREFANAHPVRSTVDVHYDPQNPSNAVLVPGADEFGDHVFVYGGIVILLLGAWQFFHTRKDYASLAAKRPKVQTTAPAHSKSALSSEPFLTYEPGSKRKLNVFPDRECLLDMLDQGRRLQVWQPDDRVIDVSGRLHRLIGRDHNKRYQMEPTGETWEWTRLLAVATSDAAIIKKDPRAMERRVAEAPDAGKIAVIMKCVNELPSAPLWFWIAVGLFLLLFFLAVMFGAGYLFRSLGR